MKNVYNFLRKTMEILWDTQYPYKIFKSKKISLIIYICL